MTEKANHECLKKDSEQTSRRNTKQVCFESSLIGNSQSLNKTKKIKSMPVVQEN